MGGAGGAAIPPGGVGGSTTPTGGNGGTVASTGGAGGTVMPTGGAGGGAVGGAGGTANPNAPVLGDATRGRDIFRFETFGNEGFWTDALQLPQGIVAAKVTPVMALKTGLSVDSDALAAAVPAATLNAIVAELKTDLSPANAPMLNDPATTLVLINANAVIGVVAKDSNADGKIDVSTGDKVGVACALCHGITDKSVFNLPTGGSIGKRVDGPAAHTLSVGGAVALAANSRAFYPLMQLKAADGSTIGRNPAFAGLTKLSSEAEVDAYLNDPLSYPVGMFDDTFDGNGNPMHNTPMFRADLAAPWGSAGEFSKLDQFANTVYTGLLDPTNLTTPGGQAFVHKVAGAAGDAVVADYVSVLAATGVTGYPYVKAGTVTQPGDPDGVLGLRVDNQKLIDMNAYMSGLPAPAGVVTDAAAVARGRAVFVAVTSRCTECHNVDQSQIVSPNIIPMLTIFPGDMPTVLATRDPPLSPIENTPGSTFDDKMIVINASVRGLVRGSAMPLLFDLARKPVFLHDNSVPTLEGLFDASRGATAPHPFYLDATVGSDMAAYLKSLDATSR
jgi:mono/diheme cytochrome c family protein